MSVSRNIVDARNQALAYALAIVEDRGEAGLREEITRRGLMGLSLLAPAKEILDMKVNITNRTVDIVMMFALYLITEEFGFDDYDAKQFYDKFNDLTANFVLDPDMNVEKMSKEVSKRVGFDIKIRKGLQERGIN